MLAVGQFGSSFRNHAFQVLGMAVVLDSNRGVVGEEFEQPEIGFREMPCFIIV
jgi:hypothetical protein